MESWGGSVLPAVAVLAVLAGAHAVTRLSGQIRRWRQEGVEKPWGRAVGEALRLAVIWGLCAAFAAVASAPSQGSEPAGAAGALLMIVGGFGFGSYAFALGLVTLVGFFRLSPDRPRAPWARHALVTGLMASATWLVLCPSPLLLSGEARPSIPGLAGLLAGVALYTLAVVSGVFWRARRPLPTGDAAARDAGTPKPGIVALALVCLLWTTVVPVGAVAVYQRLRHQDPDVTFSVFDWPFVLLWLAPVVTIIGLHRRQEWGRWAALGVCGSAVLLFVGYALWLVAQGDLIWVLQGIPLLIFGWPLWYLNRPTIRNLFSQKEKDTNRT